MILAESSRIGKFSLSSGKAQQILHLKSEWRPAVRARKCVRPNPPLPLQF